MSRRNESGFTIVEVGIIVPILMTLAIALFSIVYSYLLSANREEARLYQSYMQSAAFDRFEADIRLSTGFLQARDSNTTDPNEAASSGSTWKFGGTDTNHNVLLLREYATINNPLSTIRKPVYALRANVTDCNDPTNIAGPLAYDIVYFVKDSVLYRRILTNTSSLTCGTQYQKLSCPSIDAGGSRSASCGADDEVIATDVSAFSVTYYSDQSTTSALATDTTPALVATAKSVSLKIQNTSRSYNGSVTTASSLRTSSQNQQAGSN